MVEKKYRTLLVFHKKEIPKHIPGLQPISKRMVFFRVAPCCLQHFFFLCQPRHKHFFHGPLGAMYTSRPFQKMESVNNASHCLVSGVLQDSCSLVDLQGLCLSCCWPWGRVCFLLPWAGSWSWPILWGTTTCSNPQGVCVPLSHGNTSPPFPWGKVSWSTALLPLEEVRVLPGNLVTDLVVDMELSLPPNFYCIHEVFFISYTFKKTWFC